MAAHEAFLAACEEAGLVLVDVLAAVGDGIEEEVLAGDSAELEGSHATPEEVSGSDASSDEWQDAAHFNELFPDSMEAGFSGKPKFAIYEIGLMSRM